MLTMIYKHFHSIGIYSVRPSTGAWGHVMDDFGNLIPLDEDAFDQNVYIHTGIA